MREKLFKGTFSKETRSPYKMTTYVSSITGIAHGTVPFAMSLHPTSA